MKTLYLDLISGISGDMFLGALIDLGADFGQLEAQLQHLSIAGYHLHCTRGQKSSISGTKFDVHVSPLAGPNPNLNPNLNLTPSPLPHTHEHTHADGTQHTHPHDHGHDHGHGHGHGHHDHHHHSQDHNHDHGHPGDAGHPHLHNSGDPAHSHTHPHGQRTFADIRHLIETSGLSDWVKAKSVAVFQRVADAEGRIHGVPPDEVHFHEVGAVDSIIDIVGACLALEQLGKPRLLASPVVEGTGWIDCAHGRFPIPAPATLAILAARQIPLSQCGEPHELVTPTGAALLAEFVESFGPMRGLQPGAVGYGLGTRDHQTRPNVLRVILAETESTEAHARDWEVDTIAAIEANLDDATPEMLGHFLQQAMAAGALDVSLTPSQMKKNRPGVLLTVLCRPDQTDPFAELILTETTAFGVRIQEYERRKLRREIITVTTPLGDIQVKLGRLNGRIVQAAPEYESARLLAEKLKLPLATVYATALKHLPTP
ncbi:MAG: nickel pincer cofactor biosynthesis protein LarC [Verrucomicrobia bacterium]|nr:nickel pincer cofactor biosynthesis protein LarC [Verrucomicrobiota bacterium]